MFYFNCSTFNNIFIYKFNSNQNLGDVLELKMSKLTNVSCLKYSAMKALITNRKLIGCFFSNLLLVFEDSMIDMATAFSWFLSYNIFLQFFKKKNLCHLWFTVTLSEVRMEHDDVSQCSVTLLYLGKI